MSPAPRQGASMQAAVRKQRPQQVPVLVHVNHALPAPVHPASQRHLRTTLAQSQLFAVTRPCSCSEA